MEGEGRRQAAASVEAYSRPSRRHGEREREKEGGARALTTLWLTPPHSGVASTSRPLLSRFHSIRGPARAAKPQVLSSVPHCTIFQSLNVSLISFLFKLKLSKGVFDYTRA